ncbi:hypothetical protein MTR_3g027120 [Medicago truncatula]|uniref:Uncharacterized protein n=1 Tax=Medicago truncatula TaxID=3880 RepID=G7J1S9_MEDTR|nr:hypothetical protein MTR_3g027120 [Medicago truncatula]
MNCKRLATYKDDFETKKDTGTICKNTRNYRDGLPAPWGSKQLNGDVSLQDMGLKFFFFYSPVLLLPQKKKSLFSFLL